MRELIGNEVLAVAGGGDIADAAAVGTATGATAGALYAASAGATGTTVLAAAGLGGALLGGYAVVGTSAYAVGGLLNEYTPIQSWIADGIDAVSSWWSGSSGSEGYTG